MFINFGIAKSFELSEMKVVDDKDAWRTDVAWDEKVCDHG